MPSPVAHVGAALALIVGLAPRGGWLPVVPRRVVFAGAFASVAPDLDLLAALVDPAGLDWHRGPSHSVVGAIAIGALTAGIFRLVGWRAWAAVVGAALLHVPFDWSTGDPGAPARYGVPWAWPIASEKFIDPTPWFGAFRIDTAGFLANMWGPHALPVYVREVWTAGGLVALAVVVRRVLAVTDVLLRRLRRSRGLGPGGP